MIRSDHPPAAADHKIARNPGRIKPLVRGFVKSSLFLRREKRQVVKIIAQQRKIDADIAERSYQVMIKTFSANGAASRSAIENVIQTILRANKSQKSVSRAQVAQPTFLEKAQRDLGLRCP